MSTRALSSQHLVRPAADDDLINFKVRRFRIRLKFFSQNRIINNNKVFINRMMITIIAL